MSAHTQTLALIEHNDVSLYRKFKSGYQRPAAGTPTAAKQPAKGVDLEAVGTINDVPVFEFDISSLDDKPWRKPGLSACENVCLSIDLFNV